MSSPGRLPCPARVSAARSAPVVAVILGAAFLLLACATARARDLAGTHRLEVHYSSSHGCSQSHASTSFHGSASLALKGDQASLVLEGKHHHSMGPSLGRFRQSGGKAQTHHTASTIRLAWKGTATRRWGTLRLELAWQPPQCKTDYGYTNITAYACTGPAALALDCTIAHVPVYPAVRSPHVGHHPDKAERTALTKVLRCVPSGKDLGLVGEILFESGLPLARGAGIAHHFSRVYWTRFSALRLPGKGSP